ncbi:isochorismatase family protein [Acinetobacter qingfengensis]|uniref:Isochorismatase-like domain-containing protein n=1 Tax=Acinetobacter qingfengensis TaxID=1262585 RepID=A0A1E7R8B5_9GAMM|nr:isochorismatase family protein [Acinetobacter qingfengensis]KAA8734715.1 isochorismatase family protein [Acinetobacter qingfengensis]OEY95536.1 hypothetical protein BJI46_12740 [Acinetobacter qingfengensis]
MSIPSLIDYQLPVSGEYPLSKVKWKINVNSAALLIHDMQEYFLDYYDRDSQLIRQVIQNISELKQWCKQNNIPVFYTAQPAIQADDDRQLLNDMWGPGITAHPERKQIVAQLTPEDNDKVLDKWRYSAFFRSNLKQQLAEQHRNQLIICGVYAHIGVLQTAADAFMNGIQPFVVSDAVADFSRDDHLYALRYVQRNLGMASELTQIIQ